jgi:hypothetical protein
MATATRAKTTEDFREMQLPAIEVASALIVIEGITPLIQNKWSEKARQMMLDKQTKTAQKAKEAKNPEVDFRASLYVRPGHENDPVGTPGAYYHPASGFKQAAVEACRVLDDKSFNMTKVKALFFVDVDPVLTFSSIVMREDMVRVGQGTADIRYRGMFEGWGTTLSISYNRSSISLEQIVNLFNLGGFHNGVGEWRPSSPKGKNGEHGRFRVIEVIER